MRIVAGVPCFAATKFGVGTTTFDSHLLFYRAADANGTVWNDPVDLGVSQTQEAYEEAPLLLDSGGFPAVVTHVGYFDTHNILSFQRALDAQGDTWGAPVTVTPEADNCYLAAAGAIAGVPWIVYYNDTAIYLIKADQPEATSWGVPIEIAPAETNFVYGGSLLPAATPLLIVSALQNTTEPYVIELRVYRAQDSGGTSWVAPVVLANSTSRFSAAMVGGVPAIAVCDLPATPGMLSYIRASDNTGLTWETPVDITPGYSCSLAEVNGVPAIAYETYQDNDGLETYSLRYVHADSALGTSWSASQSAFCPLTFYGGYTSPCLVGLGSGQPAVLTCIPPGFGPPQGNYLTFKP
jgi:hypothetical protein